MNEAVSCRSAGGDGDGADAAEEVDKKSWSFRIVALTWLLGGRTSEIMLVPLLRSQGGKVHVRGEGGMGGPLAGTRSRTRCGAMRPAAACAERPALRRLTHGPCPES